MDSHAPRKVILDCFPDIGFELPINGGWGVTQDDACIIDANDPVSRPAESFNAAEIQNIFVEKHIYLGLIVFAPPEKKCSGIEWSLTEQRVVREKARVFECLHFEVTALLDKDWEELKTEWEGENGYGNESFDVEAHRAKRRERTISFQREFWFDITSCEHHTLYGIPFPWTLSDFKRYAFVGYEHQQPGLGYSVPYNRMRLNGTSSGTATIYMYDLGIQGIPPDLTNSVVIEHFEQVLAEIADARLKRQSRLMKKFGRGDLESGNGFLGAILECVEDDIQEVSAVFLTVYEQRFIKLRLTVPYGEDALDVIFGFIGAFEKVLRPPMV